MPVSRMRGRCLAAALAWATAAAPALADFQVFHPDAEPGELAVETLGDYGHDPNPAHSGEKSFTEEIEYGLADFWLVELELEQEREPGPGELVKFTQVTMENVFQFSERGRYWLDSGFFFEFGKSTLGGPNEVKFGPIFRKEMFGTINTVNLFIQKDVGRSASGRPGFSYAWETRFAFGTAIEPGFQAYGQPSGFEGFASGWPQDNRIGPQLFGTFALGPGRVTWNGGILFGLTPASPKQTLRWQVEYEIHF
jgi:hypothetical protein